MTLVLTGAIPLACDMNLTPRDSYPPQWRFISSAVAVDRQCRAEANWRFLVCQRNHYTEKVMPAKAPAWFDIVRFDLTLGTEQVLKSSKDGGEPSVAADGRVLYRKGGELILTGPHGAPLDRIAMDAEFQVFLLPVINPDSTLIALTGLRRGSPASEPSGTEQPMDLFLLDIKSRSLRQMGKEGCPTGMITDMAWQDRRTLLISTREHSKHKVFWDRTVALTTDGNRCSLVFFNDARGDRWTINAPSRLAASVTSQTNGPQVTVSNFSGEQYYAIEGGSKNLACLPDVILLHNDGRRMLLACRHGTRESYNPVMVTWRTSNEHK